MKYCDYRPKYKFERLNGLLRIVFIELENI